MNHNELMRQLRKTLAVNETGLADIYALSGQSMSPDALKQRLKQENEADFVECEDTTIAYLLEAIIIHLRGAKEGSTVQISQWPLSNNQILKKLRIAYDLKDEDMHSIFEAEETPLSKQELKALFRKEDNKNFQSCSDKLLRAFLHGLSKRARQE
jgi:uncharacterized protein YehS (DUF1456 family)